MRQYRSSVVGNICSQWTFFPQFNVLYYVPKQLTNKLTRSSLVVLKTMKTCLKASILLTYFLRGLSSRLCLLPDIPLHILAVQVLYVGLVFILWTKLSKLRVKKVSNHTRRQCLVVLVWMLEMWPNGITANITCSCVLAEFSSVNLIVLYEEKGSSNGHMTAFFNRIYLT